MASPLPTYAALKSQIQDCEARLRGNDDDSSLSSSSNARNDLDLAVRAAQLALQCLQISGLTEKEKAEMRGIARRHLARAEEMKKSMANIGSSTSSTSNKSSTTASALPDQVKRYKEPVSKRKLPKSEQIILLKASRLNGFKFPPWLEGSVPALSESALGEDGELFIDTPELSLSDHQKEIFKGWQRPNEALPPPAFISDAHPASSGPTMEQRQPIDLVQDATTNCSVIASLCSAAARAEKGHARLLRNTIYPWDENTQRPILSPNGRYHLRLNFNGCYRRVDIDDRLPTSRNERLLHTVDRNNPRFLWPALIEKAYLKVRGGYDFGGSNSNTDLWILCGWIPEQIFLQDAAEFDSVDVWANMLGAWRAGDVLITMGTGMIRKRDEKELGLAGQHGYAVLDLKDVNGQQSVLMKNPWKEGGLWKGGLHTTAYTKEDSLERELTAMSIESETDNLPPGTFWIGWNDVVQHFESVYLNWNPCMFRQREDLHFTWNLASSDNRSVNGSFTSNPQFTVKAKGNGRLWILLCRHFQDSKDSMAASGGLLGHMSIYLYKSCGERVYTASIPLTRSPYVDSPQTLLQLDVAENTGSKGTTYTAVISEQDLPAIEHGFSLVAFSDMPVELSPAKERYPICTKIKENWTSSSAGGAFQTPAYFSNPQFSLTLTQASEVALALETRADSALRINVKLVYGSGSRGERIASLTQQSIILDSGPYKSGLAFTSTSPIRADLSAGTYTIIPSTFEANQRVSFQLRVYSHDERTSVRLLPPENAGMLPLVLPPPRFPQNTTQIALPITILRNVNLAAVVERSRYRSNQSRSLIRVLLQLGHGPSCNVIRESSPEGEFLEVPPRGGPSPIKITTANLWPEGLKAYGGYCFLVLERMVATTSAIGDDDRMGSGIEDDEFEITMYCDDRPADMIHVGAWGQM